MSGVIACTGIIGALRNGMVVLNINSYVQDIVLGIVLAFAVGFDCIQKKSQQKMCIRDSLGAGSGPVSDGGIYFFYLAGDKEATLSMSQCDEKSG